MGDVTQFLTESFDRGLQYSTMNIYRSALSAYHPEIEGHQVGKHPMVITLLRGMFNMKPPLPRYGDTWDVDVVLKHLKSWGKNTNLNLRQLSLKMTMLLALVSASRGSELAQLNPLMMVDTGSSMTFHIAGLTKVKRPAKPHVKIVVSEYTEDPLLDPVAVLRHYLHTTKDTRVSEEQKKKLFLSFIRPHNPIAKNTIARWLKITLAEAGLDTGKYKAHSVRAASTSKASMKGLSTPMVLERANWARASTFKKFYHRTTTQTSDCYQDKVLTLA